MTTDDTLTCDGSNDSSGTNDVVLTVIGCGDKGRTSMQKTQAFCAYEEFCHGVVARKDNRMTT